MYGTVRWYNSTKGFGFVAPDSGGKDVFLHASALKKAGLADFREGQAIEFDCQQGKKGMEAVNVRAI